MSAQHAFKSVSAEFPDTCRHCGEFRDSITHRISDYCGSSMSAQHTPQSNWDVRKIVRGDGTYYWAITSGIHDIAIVWSELAAQIIAQAPETAAERDRLKAELDNLRGHQCELDVLFEQGFLRIEELKAEQDRLTTAILNAHGKALPENWVYTDSQTTLDLLVAECACARVERDRLRALLQQLSTAVEIFGELDIACSQQKERAAWDRIHRVLAEAREALKPR